MRTWLISNGVVVHVTPAPLPRASKPGTVLLGLECGAARPRRVGQAQHRAPEPLAAERAEPVHGVDRAGPAARQRLDLAYERGVVVAHRGHPLRPDPAQVALAPRAAQAAGRDVLPLVDRGVADRRVAVHA